MLSLARTKACCSSSQKVASGTPSLSHTQKRLASNSPYGRTHVWKRRPNTLPNPVVPKYPQTVIRSDGTSFVQWTTSPKSLLRLTRDTTNNPAWNTASWSSARSLDEESGSAGRMGRFNRRFGAATTGSDSAEPTSAGTKTQVKEKESVKVKEKDVVQELTLNGKSYNGSMGGALDDLNWFEEMADLVGTEAGASRKSGKEKKK